MKREMNGIGDALVDEDDVESLTQSKSFPSYQNADFILPPLQSPRSGFADEVSALRDYKRKTIQRKPVSINRAGRTQILSPRQIAVQHRQQGKVKK